MQPMRTINNSSTLETNKSNCICITNLTQMSFWDHTGRSKRHAKIPSFRNLSTQTTLGRTFKMSSLSEFDTRTSNANFHILLLIVFMICKLNILFVFFKHFLRIYSAKYKNANSSCVYFSQWQ